MSLAGRADGQLEGWLPSRPRATHSFWGFPNAPLPVSSSSSNFLQSWVLQSARRWAALLGGGLTVGLLQLPSPSPRLPVLCLAFGGGEPHR